MIPAVASWTRAMADYVKEAKQKLPQVRLKLEETVRGMLDRIAAGRDDGGRRYARELDHWERPDFRVTPDEIRAVSAKLPETFKQDFEYCRRQIMEFAKRQLETLKPLETEISEGVTLGHKHIPVSSAGCYVPGGKYPLISSAIMSVGTARVAGVKHIVACAPPRDSSGMYPHTLYALHVAGADEIYHLGGVQAFAAMAYG